MAELYVGLMSGTSMDGIDAVLLDLGDTSPRILAARTYPWSPAVRERLQAAARGSFLTADQFAQLDAEAGEAFAEAGARIIADRQVADVRAIGSHGQTLAHAPNASPGYSLQIGCPARIAERTGITTVADFRRRDIAAGGQGAPLVPAFHQALFGDRQETRVVLNIGGIANITCLPADGAAPVTGFDTGPGNCLMDGWITQRQGLAFDKDGLYAAQGLPQQELLSAMLDDPYFDHPPPKSTGTDYFDSRWLNDKLGTQTRKATDIQATLLALTASSIATAIQNHCRPAPARVLVCGGGAHNPLLMQTLAGSLPCPVCSTAEFGMDPNWVEAAAFAWLAQQTLRGDAGNLASVTGAKGPRILGAIHPP